MDFVVGIEIQLSNNHTVLLQPGERTSDPSQQRRDGSPKANAVRPLTDICDTLAGRYPKDFKFTGWHPHCRCRAISILKTDEELAADTERMLRGQEPTNASVNTVRDVPAAFKDWVKERSEKIETARNLPYFIRDNQKRVNRILGKVEEVKKSPLEIAKERHDARTPEQAAAIQAAWSNRRVENLRSAIDEGLLPKECAVAMDEIKALIDAGKFDEANARIAFYQQRAATHAARTPEQAQAIRKAWYDRKANNTIAELRAEGRDENGVLARIYFLIGEHKKANPLLAQAYKESGERLRLDIAANKLEGFRLSAEQLGSKKLQAIIGKIENAIANGNADKATQYVNTFVREKKKLEEAAPTIATKYQKLKLDDKTLIALKQKMGGEALDIANAESFNKSAMSGLDIPQIDKEITELFKKHGINIKRRGFKISPNGTGNASFEYEGSDDMFLERSFKVQNGVKIIGHEYFQIDPYYQERGLSKELFKVLYRYYEGIGVDRLEVHAALDVGGYTWARYGFMANNKTQAYRAIEGWQANNPELTTLRSTAKKMIDEFYSTRDDNTPYPIKQIAALEGASDLMCGSDWHGHIDLRNKEQREYFEKYIRYHSGSK